MAAYPNYASTPVFRVAQVSTANANRDGTGALATVYTVPLAGCRIEELVVTATGTTTAGMVRIFIFDGTNTRLFAEIPVTAITVGASAPAFTARLTFANLVLEAAHEIRASTHNAETFNVFAIGGTF